MKLNQRRRCPQLFQRFNTEPKLHTRTRKRKTDLTRHLNNKKTDKIFFDIYKKPTISDVIIPNDSCHPQEQKRAAVRYFSNRINTNDLDTTRKQTSLTPLS